MAALFEMNLDCPRLARCQSRLSLVRHGNVAAPVLFDETSQHQIFDQSQGLRCFDSELLGKAIQQLQTEA